MVLDVVHRTGMDSQPCWSHPAPGAVSGPGWSAGGREPCYSRRTKAYSSLPSVFSSCIYSFDLTSLPVRRVKSKKNTQEPAFYFPHFHGNV